MRHSTIDHKHPQIVYSDNSDLSNRVVLYGDHGPSLLFVPGWASTEYTWRNFIPLLAEHYRVHYFESREKPTAIRRVNNINLSLDAMSSDLISYANSIDDLRFIVGASLGATMLIHAWSKLKLKPCKVALICPNLSVSLPKYFSVLQRLPSFVVKILRPITLWSIAKFSYGADGDRIAGMLRAMKAGDVDVLRQSASQLANIDITSNQISAIDVPVLIVGTLRDEVHNLNDAVRVASKIKKSKMEKLPTFGDAHSSRCARMIDSWFQENDSD